MSPRFPPLAPGDQKPYQKIAHATMDKTRMALGSTDVFAGKDSAGALTGPFAMFIRAPEPVCIPLVDLGRTVVENPQLTVRERQLCILAVCSVYHGRFMTYAHIRITKEAGLTAEQVYDARIGKTPEGLPEKEQAAYEFSRVMAAAREVVPDELFYRCHDILGEDKITGIMHCVGLYAYTSLLMHIGDVPIPEGGKIEK